MFLSVLPRRLYILSFAISTFLTFYLNTCTSRSQDQVAPRWQASAVVLVFSIVAFDLGAAFVLVDIVHEWSRRAQERNRHDQRPALQDRFSPYVAAHRIEARATADKRHSAAVSLLQQRQGT